MYLPIVFCLIFSIPNLHAQAEKKLKYSTNSDFAVLHYDSLDKEMFGLNKNVKQAPLSQTELNKLALLLNRAAKENKLKVYKRQYVCVVDQHGDKLVWVNCFCNPYDGWRTTTQVVVDGGDCYYSLVINLTTGKYENLIVNGEA
jgi:hypothetical protein